MKPLYNSLDFLFPTFAVSHIINLLGAATSGLGPGVTLRQLLWWPTEYLKLDSIIANSPPELSLGWWLSFL